MVLIICTIIPQFDTLYSPQKNQSVEHLDQLKKLFFTRWFTTKIKEFEMIREKLIAKLAMNEKTFFIERNYLTFLLIL